MSTKRIGVVGNPGGWSSERLADTVARKTGFRCLVDLGEVSVDLDTGSARQGDLDITGLDALIVKKIGRGYAPDHLDRVEILRFVHERGVPVYSRPDRIMRVLDRLACTVTLRLAGIPMPPTVVTESVDEAVRAVRRFGRAVFKPLFTSKARGMKVIEDGRDLRSEVEEFREAGNAVLYIQRMIELPGRDLGVAFLGGEYIATYGRVLDGRRWNTAILEDGRYEPCEPAPQIVELARRAMDPFGLDFTSVDVVEADGSPLVFEVSAFGGFRGLWEAHGIDAADRYVDYVLGKLGDG